MTDPAPPVPRGLDGYYHPTSEAEVIALIDYARANKHQVRARGATHSIAWSIDTDPGNAFPADKTLERHAPAGPDIDIAFDQMMAIEWIDEASGLVEAEAGCHLGVDPLDPFGVSTLENGLLYQAAQKGWAVNITGGITHQTVAGFTGTGSAGGSTQYAFDNAIGFRVVDGLGQAAWIVQGDPEFPAILTAMGLMGIVTKVRFQLVPMYNIRGTEATYVPSGPGDPPTVQPCPIDLFGDGSNGKPSLQQHFTQMPYSRMTWYPQPGHPAVQIWDAVRVPATDQDLQPYLQFKPNVYDQTEMVLAALMLVLVGNTDPKRIMELLRIKVARYKLNMARIFGGGWQMLVASLVGCLVLTLGWILGHIPGSMKKLYPKVLPGFTPMTGLGDEEPFHDWYWRSLPMDNTADDVLLCTEFIEIWIPIQFTQQAMNLYQQMFDAGGYAATGYYAQEIYAAAPSPAWLNPSYSDGTDLYKDGVVRFDTYWYRDNEGGPDLAHGFFEQYWDMLLANQVPFRFHWGKFVPYYDFPKWAAYYKANLPMFDAFMALRARRDPDNLFFTRYWQETLLGTAL